MEFVTILYLVKPVVWSFVNVIEVYEFPFLFFDISFESFTISNNLMSWFFFWPVTNYIITDIRIFFVEDD